MENKKLLLTTKQLAWSRLKDALAIKDYSVASLMFNIIKECNKELEQNNGE